MKPASISLTIYQGSTFERSFQWKTSSPPVPVDLTGYKARMQIRENIKSADFIIEMTTENGGIIITNPVEGRIKLYISSDDTTRMNFKSAIYDLELIRPDNSVVRLFGGSVSLSLEVTR